MIRKGTPPAGPPSEFLNLLAVEREPPRLPEPQRSQLIARVLSAAAPRIERVPWWRQRSVRAWSLGLAFVAFGGAVWAGQAAFRRAERSPVTPAGSGSPVAGSARTGSQRPAAPGPGSQLSEPGETEPAPAALLTASPPLEAVSPLSPGPAPSLKRSVPDDAEELSVLNQARAAQQRGDSVAALRTISAHEQRYPRSLFAEDREALRVSALGKLGRTSEARARARAFAKRYPHSVFISKLSPWLSE